MSFRVGDKVICNAVWNEGMEHVGMQLTVASEYCHPGGQFFKSVELADSHPDHNFASHRYTRVVPAHAPAMLLPADGAERKGLPICSGVLDYFPLALAAVAKCSKVGNDQHNPGQPLHWAKEKSTDHVECIVRHLIDRKSSDTDGVPHAVKLAWRALAHLQTEIEAGRVKL